MRRVKLLQLVSILSAGFWALACGGTDDPTVERATPKIETFSANPQTLEGPGTTTLSWSTKNAESLTLSRDGTPLDLGEAAPAAGSLEVQVDATSDFSLVAEATSGLATTSTIRVVVNAVEGNAPTIGSFSGPEVVGLPEGGPATVTLSWSGVVGATALSIEADGRQPIVLNPASGSGSVDVSLEEDTTFDLLAINEWGETWKSVPVRVVARPSITHFEADRLWVGVFDKVIVAWETEGATRIELRLDGLPVEEVAAETVSGSHEFAPFADSTIELVAFNELNDSVSSTIEVTVDSPSIEHFAGSDLGRWLGEAMEFSWITHGGSLLEVTIDGEEGSICTATTFDAIDESSCRWVSELAGEYDFTLTVSNGSGAESETWSAVIGPGPSVAEFSVQPEAINLGEELTIRWAAGPDPMGELPTLELMDGRGNQIPTPDPTGVTTHTPTAAGTHVFTLTASTSHELSRPATATQAVEVYELPKVSLVATPSYFDELVDDDVVLSWTSEHAVSLVLYEVLPSGEEELHVVEEKDLREGSFHFIPKESGTIRIIATNRAGATEAADVVLTLAPPRVLSLTVDPPVVEAGQPVLLTWTTTMADEVALDFMGGPYVREETTEPYLDITKVGGSHFSMTYDCDVRTTFRSLETFSCAELQFPSGFAFPFDGVNRSAARIYSNGVVSFDHAFTAPSSHPAPEPQGWWTNSENQLIPTPANRNWMHLALFWNNLDWGLDLYPLGNIYYLLRESPEGRSLIVQWTDIYLGGKAHHRTTSLNFQVVLWENGDFEYRYGNMHADDTLSAIQQDWVNGTLSTIGFQTPSQTVFDLMRFNRNIELRGPLHQRSFRYKRRPTLQTSGSYLWHPSSNEDAVTAKLTASRGELADSQTVNLTVLEGATLAISGRPTEPVLVNTNFRLGWKTTFATDMAIFDESGTERCKAASQPEINEGFCTLQEAFEGVHRYRLRVTGRGGIVREKFVQVTSYEDFGIDSFKADKEFLEHGEGLNLSWVTRNAHAISLKANGVELLPTGAPSGPGSLDIPKVEGDTTFVLRVTNSLGMFVEKSVSVELWKVRIGVQPSATSVRPGETIEIDLSAIALDGGATPTIFGSLPMVEDTSPAAAYVDISKEEIYEAVRTKLSLTSTGTSTITNINFPPGFTFKYFGKEYSGIRAFVDGYVSLNMAATLNSSNQLFPIGTADNYKGVNLAPFWDNLHPRDNFGAAVGEMWTAQVDPNTFIIQWNKMSMDDGSANSSGTTTPARVQDLNFQLVLRRDGSFEYRYGNMRGLQGGLTNSSCHPNTCVNEANGSSATIGYQDPTGAMGYNVHFGGSANGAQNIPFPGGLSNRTFRYNPVVGSGKVQIAPTRAGSYHFCSLSGDKVVCKRVDVKADFGIESFESSSPSIAFGASATLSWKTKGGRELVVRDGAGNVVYSTTDPAIIDSGSVVVDPKVNTSYHLEIKATANAATATTEVEVIRLSLTAQLPQSTSFPGTPLTLSWTLNRNDPSADPILVAPMEEIHGATFADMDISSHAEGVIEVHVNQSDKISVLPFEGGFTFDYFGVKYDHVRVSTEGYLSFDPTATSVSSANQSIPNSTVANRRIHIAPFWEDLHTRAQGRVYAKKWDEDTYVIQWLRMSLNTVSTNTNQGNLNFLVVLKRNGDFEFRYGDMEPAPQPGTATQCYPASCLYESNGSSATISYQDPSGAAGFELHYGGTGRAANQLPVGGFLSNRSWKFTRRTAAGSVQVAPYQDTTYKVCAFEVGTGDVYCAEPLSVRVPWGINAFAVSERTPVRGQSTTFSWDVTGMDRVAIYADGAEVVSYNGPSVPPLGSFTHTPSETTLYTFEASSMKRRLTREVLVEIRGFNLAVTAPSGRHFPGDTVNLSWTLTQLEPGIASLTNPMVEVPAGPGHAGEFKSIAGIEGATQAQLSANAGHAVLDIPFEFPYFGKKYSRVQAYVYGYLAFDIDTSASSGAGISTNTPFPTSISGRRVNIAVFWDQMFRRGTGADEDKMWTYRDGDRFIIEWSHFNRAGGSSTNNLYDMNFQIILHTNGAFEYRYGKMAPPPAGDSGCFPASCWEEANGSSATIGYQTVGAEAGYTFHFGGQGRDGVVPLAGGLNNRTLRFDPATTGSTQVKLDGSREYTVCGAVGLFMDCKTVYLQAVADPGDLMITELMIDPAGGSQAQWFELRNLSKRVIDLEGFDITTDTGSHRIGRSLLLGSEEYLTIGHSAAAGFTPSYAHGSSLAMNKSVENLAVKAGTATITSVNWGASWTVPNGTTLALESSYQSWGRVAYSEFSRWCPGTAAGTPGARSPSCFSPFYDVEPYSDLPFYDISKTGTRATETEGWFGVYTIPAPSFSMPFFEVTVNKVTVNSNGWISFADHYGGGSDSVSPSQLPRQSTATPTGPLVAGFWEEAICEPAKFPCSFHYQQGVFGGKEMLILQWTGFRARYSTISNRPGGMTYQVQLWRDGTVVSALADFHWEDGDNADGGRQYRGNSAWIGLEGPGQKFISGHHRFATDTSHRTIVFTRK